MKQTFSLLFLLAAFAAARAQSLETAMPKPAPAKAKSVADSAFVHKPAPSPKAVAPEAGVKAKLLLDAGIEYGGDELLKVFFTNGGDQTMRAGQGGYLAVGGQLAFPKVKPLLLRASLGIKYNTTAADNANIRLTRLPVVLMPYWVFKEHFRLGVGIAKHLNVQFKGDDFLPDASMTSSAGPRFEFGYKWIALTYTSLSYTTEAGREFSASSLGLSASFVLPNR
jgi:hypothetical protein